MEEKQNVVTQESTPHNENGGAGVLVKQKKISFKLPLFLIFGPFVTIVGSILLYAVVNFIITSSNANPPGEVNIFRVIANIILFVLGAGGVLTFLPCLIIGIILFFVRRHAEHVYISELYPGNPPIQKSKKSLIFGFVIFCGLVAIAFIGYLLLFTTPNSPFHYESDGNTTLLTGPIPKNSSSVLTGPNLPAEQTVAAINKLNLSGKTDPVSELDDTGTGPFQEGLGWAYPVGGRGFAVDPQKAYTTDTKGSLEDAGSSYSVFKSYLTGHGFKIIKRPTNKSAFADALYKSTSSVCYIIVSTIQYPWSLTPVNQQDPQIPSSESSAPPNIAQITCGDLSSYTANAVMFDPFYKLMTTGDPSRSKNNSDGVPPYLYHLTVKDGVDGYENASIMVTNYVTNLEGEGFELFYKAPSQDWKYVTFSGGLFSCESLTATSAIEKSFAGQECYPSNGNGSFGRSTVVPSS